MRISLLLVPYLLFALFIRADINADKSKATNKGDDYKAEEAPKNGYRVISGPPVEEPPIYQEIRVPVIQKIPVVRRLIKVYRPEIKQVFVPVDVEEKVRGAPLMAAPFDDILEDQPSPRKNGHFKSKNRDSGLKPGVMNKGQFSGPRVDSVIK